jgi:sec-independent protein translocase protein TatA
MGGIGIPELAIVLLIVLVIFGPKRLPQLGRQLGSGMREFKDSITSRDKDDEEVPALEPAPQRAADPVRAEPARAETVHAEPVRDDAPAPRD